MQILIGIAVIWVIVRIISKTFRGVRDVILLCMVIVYSGAHMPSAHGLASIGESFKAGYDRAVLAQQSAVK